MDDELRKNFSAVLEILHKEKILFSEATRKQIDTALAKVRKMSQKKAAR